MGYVGRQHSICPPSPQQNLSWGIPILPVPTHLAKFSESDILVYLFIQSVSGHFPIKIHLVFTCFCYWKFSAGYPECISRPTWDLSLMLSIKNLTSLSATLCTAVWSGYIWPLSSGVPLVWTGHVTCLPSGGIDTLAHMCRTNMRLSLRSDAIGCFTQRQIHRCVMGGLLCSRSESRGNAGTCTSMMVRFGGGGTAKGAPFSGEEHSDAPLQSRGCGSRNAEITQWLGSKSVV